MKPPKFKLGERVRLVDMAPDYAEFDGQHGTVAGVLDRGDGCDLYAVDLDCGAVAQVCDHHLDTGKPLAPDFSSTVPWSLVGWRPRPKELPEMISGVLRRLRSIRLGKRLAE